MKKNGSTIKLPTVDSCAVFQISSRKFRRVAFLLLYVLPRAAFPSRLWLKHPSMRSPRWRALLNLASNLQYLSRETSASGTRPLRFNLENFRQACWTSKSRPIAWTREAASRMESCEARTSSMSKKTHTLRSGPRKSHKQAR